MDITFFGQSCFLVTVGKTKLLFDPFISGNPNAQHIALDSIRPDVILLSHGHGDHITDTETIAKQSGAQVIAIYEVAAWFEKKGLEKVTGINLGGTVTLPDCRIQMVPAWHSSTLPDGSNGGTAAGFIVTHDEGCFYFSGDTALFQEMKLFGRRHKIDLAFLCLGDHYTMGAEDAVFAAEFLGTKRVVGMHFDTFPPIAIDHDVTKALFEKAGVSLKLPTIGETFSDKAV